MFNRPIFAHPFHLFTPQVYRHHGQEPATLWHMVYCQLQIRHVATRKRAQGNFPSISCPSSLHHTYMWWEHVVSVVRANFFFESLSLPGSPCSCGSVSAESTLPEIWPPYGHHLGVCGIQVPSLSGVEVSTLTFATIWPNCVNSFFIESSPVNERFSVQCALNSILAGDLPQNHLGWSQHSPKH